MLSRVLAGIVEAVIAVVIGWLVLTPSPRSAADRFVQGLPNGKGRSAACPCIPWPQKLCAPIWRFARRIR